MNEFYVDCLKRVIDFLLSIVGAIILSPIMILIAMIIKIDSSGPVLFKQERIGAGESTFTILKFRTMFADTPKDVPTHMLNNPDLMITRVGKILRKTSLDELPQLFNIICGDMSIIGPRPALWNQFDLIEVRRNITDKGKNVNDLRPGLTGWAQVNGRDELPIDVKAGLDGEYLKNISLGFDLKCFFKTIKVVITHEGIVEGISENREE